MAYLKLVLFFFLTCTTSSITQGVEYNIMNSLSDTVGGARYTHEIGDIYTLQLLDLSTKFIWKIFHQFTEADRKNTTQVSLYITQFPKDFRTPDKCLYIDTNYMGWWPGNLTREFTGSMYHQMTYVWQWNGNGTTPPEVIEGIAAFVRLKAGYVPSDWVGPGGGNYWKDRKDVTAQFLDYCNDLKDGFVAELNKRMRNGYGDFFFVEILGKSVEELWGEYKAKYV